MDMKLNDNLVIALDRVQKLQNYVFHIKYANDHREIYTPADEEYKKLAVLTSLVNKAISDVQDDISINIPEIQNFAYTLIGEDE